ncbi:MAG: MFS transporter [Oscillospiraceae bacterium]|nr:MFS transporter [Oscillospiraceae bacterium]
MGKINDILSQVRQREHEEGRLSVKEYISFALTQFGLGSIGAVPGGQRMLFYTSIGIPATQAGLIMTTSGIWDLFSDPVVATIIDRGKLDPKRPNRGKFTRWLAPMVPFFAMASVLMFINPPVNSITAKIVFCFLAYFIFEVFSTFVNISFQTMRVVMSPLQDERSNYITFGNISGLLTGALPGLIPLAFSLLAEGNDAQPAMLRASSFFTVIAIFFAVLGMVPALFSKHLKERVFAPKRSDRFFENVRTFFKNRYFLLLWTSNIPNLLAGVSWVAAPFFFIYSVGDFWWQTVVWTASGVPTFLVMLLSPLVLKRFQPRTVSIFSRLLNAGCKLGVFFITGALGYTTIPGLIVLVALFTLSSIPSGIQGIADDICNINTFDYTEWKTGERAEATTFVVGGMFSKAINHLAPLIAGVLMARAGFVSAAEGVSVTQAPHTRDALFAFYTIFPAIAVLLGTIPYFLYKLQGPMFDQVQADLAERRKIAKESDIDES